MNGIHPMPLSTDTIFRSGWRSNIPEYALLRSTRELFWKSDAPPIAGFTYSSWLGQYVVPKYVSDVWLAPMWKCTGRGNSSHTSQNGAPSGLPRSGDPESCGSEVMFRPRYPIAAQRFASRTHSSTLHAGMIGMGTSRPFDDSCVSAKASLYSCTHSNTSSWSRTVFTRFWPPRPIEFG